jgi:hypothetical protein
MAMLVRTTLFGGMNRRISGLPAACIANVVLTSAFTGSSIITISQSDRYHPFANPQQMQS